MERNAAAEREEALARTINAGRWSCVRGPPSSTAAGRLVLAARELLGKWTAMHTPRIATPEVLEGSLNYLPRLSPCPVRLTLSRPPISHMKPLAAAVAASANLPT
jgi:hypothetical protein